MINKQYKWGYLVVILLCVAAMVAGAKAPCVLSSRADSIDTKLNSIAIAAMSVK